MGFYEPLLIQAQVDLVSPALPACLPAGSSPAN